MNKKKIVQTTHDACLPFKRRKIVDKLMEETGVKESVAINIARAVEYKVNNMSADIITTADIREEVNTQLRKRGMSDEARQHERVGIPVADIRSLIRGHNTDNANLQRNPETFHKFVADAALKQYALMCLPKELAKAHDKGDVHVHDLEYFTARPINCLQHDLRWFIKEGLSVDGTKEHTSVAGPPKRLETLMNHAGEIMLAGQQNCSGGQGMSLWNVFSAPFCEGLTYEQILQKVQMFIFNLNMAYSNRGGQVPFTSINLEFTVPKFLQKETAYGEGGHECGVYGDWETETRLLNEAFLEVMLEGDAIGKPHLFPNSIWMLREEMMHNEFDREFNMVEKLSAKYSTPYFGNTLPKWTGGHSNIMGCRTRLNANWTGDWDKDTLRTGNLAYVSLNLPRMSYNKEGDNNVEDNMNRALGLAEEILILRREHAIKCLDKYNLLPFLAQRNKEGERYYRIENSTLSFGVVGMNEMLVAEGIEGGLESKDGQKQAKQILKYINNYAKELTEDTGYRWTVLQTPGETTAHRFATLDRLQYPKQAITQGEQGSYYYTNSTHLPVCSELNLFERIKIESKFHPLTSGGHIMHAFLGEACPDPAVLGKLTQRIANKTDAGFWAYTSAFSFCFNDNTFMRGLQDVCNECGSTEEIEHYSRITGYLQQVGNKKDSSGGWNAGKRQELKDRHQYEV